MWKQLFYSFIFCVIFTACSALPGFEQAEPQVTVLVVTATPEAGIPQDTPLPPEETLVPSESPQAVEPSVPTATTEPVEMAATATPPAGTASPTEALTVDSEELIGSGVQITTQDGAGSGLQVVVLDPDGQAWEGKRVQIYTQQQDASGNPVTDEEVGDWRTDQQGQYTETLNSDLYAVCAPSLEGYSLTERDCVYDVAVSSDQTTVVQLQVGRLEVGTIFADGSPWEGKRVQIFTQQADISGQPTRKDEVGDLRTANTGIAELWIVPGHYAVTIDLPGYNWGELQEAKGTVDVAVRAGETNRLVVQLGALEIGLVDAGGQPVDGRRIQIYLQEQDVSGNPVPGDEVFDSRTDNTGKVTAHLTAGTYVVEIGEQLLPNVPVEEGRVTKTDGQTVSGPEEP